MADGKFNSGRGGKRPGAGRPKGSTVSEEKRKKMHSFRLTKEEEVAVRALLSEMRGK